MWRRRLCGVERMAPCLPVAALVQAPHNYDGPGVRSAQSRSKMGDTAYPDQFEGGGSKHGERLGRSILGPRCLGVEATRWMEPQRTWSPSSYVASGPTFALGLTGGDGRAPTNRLGHIRTAARYASLARRGSFAFDGDGMGAVLHFPAGPLVQAQARAPNSCMAHTRSRLPKNPPGSPLRKGGKETSGSASILPPYEGSEFRVLAFP
jgi:hypothetical protein